MKHLNSTSKRDYFLFYSLLFFLLGLCFPLKLKMHEIFAEKYFYDSYKILYLMHSDISLGDKAFDFSAKFYNFLNIFHIYNWDLWALILTFITMFILLLSMSFIRAPKINVFLIFWLLMSIVLLLIYVTHISKEWITFLFSLLFAVVFKKMESKKLFLVLCILIFLYSYFFRTYFGLVFIYFCIFFMFFNYRKSRLWIVLIVIFILIVVPNKYLFEIFYIRQDLNYYRMDSVDAQTMISDVFISNNNFIMFFNYLLNIFRLLFPLEVIFVSFKIKYVFFVIYMLLNSYIIFFNVKNYNKLSTKQKNILIFLLSIIVVHGIFEPDYGSYIRHFISYFFIIYLNVLIYIHLKLNEISLKD